MRVSLKGNYKEEERVMDGTVEGGYTRVESMM